jgi:hypothetical protein
MAAVPVPNLPMAAVSVLNLKIVDVALVILQIAVEPYLSTEQLLFPYLTRILSGSYFLFKSIWNTRVRCKTHPKQFSLGFSARIARTDDLILLVKSRSCEN